MVNPELQGDDFTNSYLNSLYWFAFPDGSTIDESSRRTEVETRPWYQMYVSRPHNRAVISYDAEEISATFSNVFANPGLALNFAGWGVEIDDAQSLNGSVGYLLGGIFEAVNYDNINESLDEAKGLFDQGEILSTLETQATSEQRRAINQRLNESLLYANFNSGIETPSGRMTFGSNLTPDRSNLWQLRTGLSERRVQLITEPDVSFTPGQAFLSEVDTSSRSSLLLNYLGVLIPEERVPGNSAAASQVVLTTPNGDQFLIDNSNLSSIPVSLDGVALAFDDLSITRIDERRTQFSIYEGIINVPSIELAKAGSSGRWYHSVNVGLWANLDSQIASGLEDDLLFDDTEDRLGAYAKGYLSAVTRQSMLDEDGNVSSVRTSGPTFRSNVETTGEFFLTAGYELSDQNADRGWTIRPTVAYIADQEVDGEISNEFVTFLRSQIGWRSGFSLTNDLQLGEDFYVALNARQKVSDSLSLGAYIQNYDREIAGLQDRVDAFTYGGIIRYAPRGNERSFYESKIGGGENGFDFEFRSRFTF